MRVRTGTDRLLALALASSLALTAPAAWALDGPAALAGVIRDAERAPLAGARLLAAPAGETRLYRSEPAGPDGGFELGGLPAGDCALAVEVDGGLYVVEAPVVLVPGVKRAVQVSVGHAAPGAVSPAAEPTPDAGGSRSNLWNNPLTAGLIVLGAAIVVGAVVKNVTDDEPNATEN